MRATRKVDNDQTGAECNAVQLGKALNDPIKGIAPLTRSGVLWDDLDRKDSAAAANPWSTIRGKPPRGI
jgi:hypothetical protein